MQAIKVLHAITVPPFESSHDGVIFFVNHTGLPLACCSEGNIMEVAFENFNDLEKAVKIFLDNGSKIVNDDKIGDEIHEKYLFDSLMLIRRVNIWHDNYMMLQKQTVRDALQMYKDTNKSMLFSAPRIVTVEEFCKSYNVPQ